MPRGEILYVEDSENDVELTCNALRDIGLDDEIVIARDGEEAMDYFSQRGRFSDRTPGVLKLVLLDLKIPKVNGLEVLRGIKTNNAVKDVPVVVFTSSREERDLFAGYSLGLNAYVVKPIGFDDFCKIVREIGNFWTKTNELPPVSLPRL